jgi:hypothetical protein
MRTTWSLSLFVCEIHSVCMFVEIQFLTSEFGLVMELKPMYCYVMNTCHLPIVIEESYVEY